MGSHAVSIRFTLFWTCGPSKTKKMRKRGMSTRIEIHCKNVANFLTFRPEKHKKKHLHQTFCLLYPCVCMWDRERQSLLYRTVLVFVLLMYWGCRDAGSADKLLLAASFQFQKSLSSSVFVPKHVWNRVLICCLSSSVTYHIIYQTQHLVCNTIMALYTQPVSACCNGIRMVLLC